MSDRKCAIYGPADFWLCDRMKAEVEAGTRYRRNPDFGVGGRMDLSAVLEVHDWCDRVQLPTCPFCGGALRKVEAPALRATPQAISGALIPDWRAVSRAIPPDFRCDGSSDPTLLYLLSATSFIPWCKRTSVAINEAGRIHDFGYGPARLPGSGFEHFSKDSWDAMYRQCLIDKGHPVIANTHWRGVEWFGGRAWRKNWRRMQDWGWYTYASFLADVDKTVEPMGML